MSTNIKNDHDALLERIAIAIEEKTGASPDEQTDRKNASGAILERIAEAIENGSGGGSSDLFIVTLNVTYDEESKPVFSADKTNAEIYKAYTDGKILLLKDDTRFYMLHGEVSEDYAEFVYTSYGNGSTSVETVYFYLENNVLDGEFYRDYISLRFDIQCTLNNNTLTTNSEMGVNFIYTSVSAGNSVTFIWLQGGYQRKARAFGSYGQGGHVHVYAMMTDGNIIDFEGDEGDPSLTATISVAPN